jgi:hypothetical protein
MYSYSHPKNSVWLGEFERPADCLLAGRAAFGADKTIYVSEWAPAHYSDLFIGAEALLSYMREDAVGKINDADLDAFDSITADDKARLTRYMVDLLGEWEGELAGQAQFKGSFSRRVRSYGPADEVRVGHFRD